MTEPMSKKYLIVKFFSSKAEPDFVTLFLGFMLKYQNMEHLGPFYYILP